MPNSKSAEKRVRQNAKRQALNNWRKRRIKLQTKTFLDAVHGTDVKAAEAEFKKACSVLDKVGCTSTMHRNTVARRKSKLSRQLLEMKQRVG